jgi:hypothetical protein
MAPPSSLQADSVFFHHLVSKRSLRRSRRKAHLRFSAQHKPYVGSHDSLHFSPVDIDKKAVARACCTVHQALRQEPYCHTTTHLHLELGNALYHWTRVRVQHDSCSDAKYVALRQHSRSPARALRSGRRSAAQCRARFTTALNFGASLESEKALANG